MFTFIFKNFNPLYLRMHWAKFGWNLPRSSWVVAKNEKKTYNDSDDNSWSEELRTKLGIWLFERVTTDLTQRYTRLANFGEYLSHADVIHLNRPRTTASV